MEKAKKIEKKIEKKMKEIFENKLILEKERILVAFSGGPDSVFLYHFLNNLKKKFLLEISIVYINHNLRYDVENDLKFVKKFALENDVDYYVESVDVKKYAKENRKSLELAARELRYEAIERVRKKINYNKIATGHNLDDNVETFVFRLLRGTSLTGLKGIPKIRENIIRPILEFEKKEILYFLKQNNLKYIIDYTNNENDFTRNFIRNKIFPNFEKVNPNFKQKVYTLIEEINESENEKLEISEVFKTNKKFKINLKEKEKLAQFLKQNNVEISRDKINQIFDSFFYKNGILKNEGSKEIYLGKDKFLQNQYGKLKIIENRSEKPKTINNSFEKLEILKKNQSIEWYNYKIMLYENISDFKANFVNERDINYTFFKFSDNIEKYDRIIVRNRRDGDKIFVKNLGHKKVKKILIDEKISKWERDLIPIIEIETSENQVYLGNFENKKIETEKSIFDFPIGAKDIKIKEILTVSDIKFSKFLEKIYNNEIEKLENTSKLLIIGRKNGR
jgi:tRNA(ile)-lysidine synthetase